MSEALADLIEDMSELRESLVMKKQVPTDYARVVERGIEVVCAFANRVSASRSTAIPRAKISYNAFRAGFSSECPAPEWDQAPTWVRDVVHVAYLQGKLDR